MRKKRKNVLPALLLAVSMMLSTAVSFGAVAYDGVKAIKAGGAGYSSFAQNVSGRHAPWNDADKAIEAEKEYVNRLIPASSWKAALQAGARLESSRDIVFNGTINTFTMPVAHYFVFDVSNFKGTKNGAIRIKYTGFKIVDQDHPSRDGEDFVWVDVVATVTNWTKEDSGWYDNDKNAFAISRSLDGGYPAINLCNIGELTVKYDYYLAGTSTKYALKTNVTYTDIDACQGIAFTGRAVKKTAVTSDTNILYGKNGNWHVFTTSSETDELATEPKNALGMMYESDGEKITYISNQRAGGDPKYGEPSGVWSYFDPSTYGWFQPPDDSLKPVKTVSDSNETDVRENTVSKKEPKWTYHVTQHIPAGMSTAFYYNKFIMTDEVDTCLKVTGVKVKNRSGQDVTANFDIVIGADNVVTATARAAYLKNSDFYGAIGGNSITMEISVALDETKFAADKDAHGHVIAADHIEIHNDAAVTINDTQQTTNDVKTIITSNPAPAFAPAGKKVSDDDETRVTSNWLDAPDETFTYEVSHTLPSISPLIDEETGEELGMPYFTGYEFSDTLEDILRPVSAKVMSGGSDVSSDFNIRISGQTVTAGMKGGALRSDASYGATYTLTIETEIRTDAYSTQAKLAPWLSSDKLTLIIPNSAAVTATDHEGTPNTQNTNEVETYVGLPEEDGGDPGIEIHKSVEPYEFQVGDEIPYKITLNHNNKKATAMDVIMRDNTLPKGLNVKAGSIRVSGLQRAYTAVPIANGIEFSTGYLEYGEKVTIEFIAVAEKSLNGKVIPNTATVGAWGVPDKQAGTTIYINSPKIDVDKTVSKQGSASVNNTINYELRIRQIHPGCFMRDIWLEDEILTEGVELDKGSFSVTDTDGNMLALNTDYTINVRDNKFKMVFTRGNMGYYAAPVIPPWDDARGKATGDYDALELQKEYIVTYTATVDAGALAGKHVDNHAVVPSTENTNGDVIRDDPNIPSGGGEDAVRILIDGPNLKPEKASDKREYNVDDTAEYKLTVGLTGSDMRAENVVITDRFQQEGIAVINSDSIKVRFNNTDITWQCRIKADDDLQGFRIDTGRNLTEKDTITVEYLADILGDGVLLNTMRAVADNAPEVDWDNDIAVLPKPALMVEKTSDKEGYTVGEAGSYEVTVRQTVPGAVAEKVVIEDTFMQEGMSIDAESFQVMLNEDDITDQCIIKPTDGGWKIETRRNMSHTDAVVVTYDVFFTDGAKPGKVNNIAIAGSENTPDAETEHEVYLKEVPPELEITKGSDKDAYALGETAKYTVTVKQVKENAVARNVVIDDSFAHGGMEIDADSIKVLMGEEDITEECRIDAAERNWVIYTGKELRLEETMTVGYDVKFTDISREKNRLQSTVTTGPATTGTEVKLVYVSETGGTAHNIAATAADNASRKETAHIVALKAPAMASKLMSAGPPKKAEKPEDGTGRAVGTGDDSGAVLLLFATLLALSGVAALYVCKVR